MTSIGCTKNEDIVPTWKRFVSLLLVSSLFAVATPTSAPASTGAGLETEALRLIESGRPSDAIDLLRDRADSAERSLLLARAYLDDGNDFWAMRILQELAHESDGCGPHLWLAFAMVRQGALDDGRDMLELAECPAGSTSAARRHLLEVLIATTEGRTDEAREALREATGHERAFAEDVRAMRALRSSVEEHYVSPISGRLELHSGWTSNSLAGSPTDPSAPEDFPAGGLAHLAGNARFMLPTSSTLRPALDTELRAIGMGAKRGRDASYLQVSARPALLFGPAGKALVGYRFDTLGIWGGDQYDAGPLLFYQAHRGEIDLELAPWLTVFGGVGHRVFRESRRSRLEVDGGIGGAWRPLHSLNLLGAVTARHHRAAREFYDLTGATAIVQAQWRLPRGLSARLGLMGSIDDYPESTDFFAQGVARRDLLVKLTSGLWLPPTSQGVRAGLTYELSNRASSAPDYEYSDHRVLLRAQWAFSADPRGPRAETPTGHVPLAWGLEDEGGALEESIQDLLRQDEAVRAGSSCID